jgi:hypothetical protein
MRHAPSMITVFDPYTDLSLSPRLARSELDALRFVGAPQDAEIADAAPRLALPISADPYTIRAEPSSSGLSDVERRGRDEMDHIC